MDEANDLTRLSAEITKLSEWKADALDVIRKYQAIADLACPKLDVGCSRVEALQNFVIAHKNCDRVREEMVN